MLGRLALLTTTAALLTAPAADAALRGAVEVGPGGAQGFAVLGDAGDESITLHRATDGGTIVEPGPGTAIADEGPCDLGTDGRLRCPVGLPFAARMGGGEDTVVGGAVAEVLDGGAGDDELEGGGGDDRLIGGDGDDELTGGRGGDQVEGGAGRDALRGDVTATGRLLRPLERDVLRGGAGDDSLEGEGTDDLLGEAGDDTLALDRRGERRRTISCGAGRDDVRLEAGDPLLVRADCERVASDVSDVTGGDTEVLAFLRRGRLTGLLVSEVGPSLDEETRECDVPVRVGDGPTLVLRSTTDGVAVPDRAVPAGRGVVSVRVGVCNGRRATRLALRVRR